MKFDSFFYIFFKLFNHLACALSWKEPIPTRPFHSALFTLPLTLFAVDRVRWRRETKSERRCSLNCEKKKKILQVRKKNVLQLWKPKDNDYSSSSSSSSTSSSRPIRCYMVST